MVVSDRANQKDTTVGDRVYPVGWHGGGGATRSGGAPGNSAHRRGSSRSMVARLDWAARGARRSWTRGVKGAKADRRGGDAADPPNSNDAPDLAASMAAQGRGVWPGLAATTAAQDGARSICLHAMKIRKVLMAVA